MVDFVMLCIFMVVFEIYGLNGVKFGIIVGYSFFVIIYLLVIYCWNFIGFFGVCIGVFFNNLNSFELYIIFLKYNLVVDKL